MWKKCKVNEVLWICSGCDNFIPSDRVHEYRCRCGSPAYLVRVRYGGKVRVKGTLSCCNGMVGELDGRGYIKFDSECSMGHHGIWIVKPFEDYYDLVVE